MLRIFTILVVLLTAGLFWAEVPVSHLFNVFQPLITGIAIMVAALFVRLNRGVPNFEWSTLDFTQRAKLTTMIVELTREYMQIIAIDAIILFLMIVFMAIGKDNVAKWPTWAQHLSTSVIGAFILLSVIRMGYVTWRDYDIVRLQKQLIDTVGSSKVLQSENRAADGKISDIRAANVRKIPITDPKAWGNDR